MKTFLILIFSFFIFSSLSAQQENTKSKIRTKDGKPVKIRGTINDDNQDYSELIIGSWKCIKTIIKDSHGKSVSKDNYSLQFFQNGKVITTNNEKNHNKMDLITGKYMINEKKIIIDMNTKYSDTEKSNIIKLNESQLILYTRDQDDDGEAIESWYYFEKE